MPRSTKKSTNLSVRAELLTEARALGINLSQVLEVALRAEVKRVREKRWLEENKAAFEAYNREVAQYGLWSDGSRLF